MLKQHPRGHIFTIEAVHEQFADQVRLGNAQPVHQRVLGERTPALAGQRGNDDTQDQLSVHHDLLDVDHLDGGAALGDGAQRGLGPAHAQDRSGQSECRDRFERGHVHAGFLEVAGHRRLPLVELAEVEALQRRGLATQAQVDAAAVKAASSQGLYRVALDQAKAAGIDLRQVQTGISDDFFKQTGAINGTITSLGELGVVASKADPQLGAAINKQIEAAKTREELEFITAELQRASDKGLLFGSTITGAMDRVRQRAQELNTDLANTIRAIEKLGGSADYLKGKLNSTSSLTNPDGSQKGPNAPASGIGSDSFANFSTNPGSGPITGSYDIGAVNALLQKQRAGTLSESDLATIEAALSANKFNLGSLQSVSNQASVSSSAYASLQQERNQLNRLKAAIDAQKLQPAAPASTLQEGQSSAPRAVSGGYEIRFVMGGTTHTAIAQSSSAAEALVRDLEAAFKAAGGG